MGLKQRYLYQNFESTTLLYKEINMIICNQGYNTPVIPQLTNVVQDNWDRVSIPGYL